MGIRRNQKRGDKTKMISEPVSSVDSQGLAVFGFCEKLCLRDFAKDPIALSATDFGVSGYNN